MTAVQALAALAAAITVLAVVVAAGSRKLDRLLARAAEEAAAELHRPAHGTRSWR